MMWNSDTNGGCDIQIKKLPSAQLSKCEVQHFWISLLSFFLFCVSADLLAEEFKTLILLPQFLCTTSHFTTLVLNLI